MTTSSDHTSDVTLINGKYAIQKKLSSGEYGDVYKAIQLTTEQIVAVKFIKIKEYEDAPTIEKKKTRFLREMKLCKELFHPGIVQVIDTGITETSRLYSVFEFIPGKTLANILLEDGALSVKRTFAIMTQILDALSAAHKRGIIHRDLKPENIMITLTGTLEQVKILDFGIGAFLPNSRMTSTIVTQTNEFLGTPAYASPEQLKGVTASEKADIYAWGLIFLECLTGKHPYDKLNAAQLIHKQLSGDSIPLPIKIQQHRLGNLLKWVLEKNSLRRAGNADRVLRRLQDISFTELCKESPYITDSHYPIDTIENNNPLVSTTIVSNSYHRLGTILNLSFSLTSQLENNVNSELIDEVFLETLGQCSKIIEGFGGYIESCNNCGLLTAVFGYPQIKETDSRISLESVFQVLIFLKRQNVTLKEKLGILITMKGVVFTGQMSLKKIANQKHPQIFGSLFRFASAVCKNTSEEILLNDKCYDLIKNYYDCKPVKIDTIEDEFYTVKSKKRLEGLSKGAEIDKNFIGRIKELDILSAHLRRIYKQTTRSILISGEAGIGKSSLLAKFAHIILKQKSSWLLFQFTPESAQSALFPILKYIKSEWNLNNECIENELIIEKYLKSITDSIKLKIAVPILCMWLGFKCVKYPPVQQAPIKQKEILLDLLVKIITFMMKQDKPILFCEDLHWADSLSLEFLSQLITILQKSKLLAVFTSRNGYALPWEANTCKNIFLKPLDRDEIEEVLVAKGLNPIISPTVKEKIIERCDGNPLFLEELTQMISPGEENKGDFEDIPYTLRELLNSKLENIGLVKDTALLASVVGRSFTYSMLSKISLKDEAALLADLDELVSLGILHSHYSLGEFIYSFQHALIRDSAYENIPDTVKKNLHEKLAIVIETQYSDMVNTQPELLFHHWNCAENYDKASRYGVKAAQIALSRTLNDIAIDLSQKSIEICRNYINEKERELILHNILAQAMMFKYGWGNPHIFSVLNKAIILLEQCNDLNLKVQTLWNQIMIDGVAGFRTKARESSEKLVELTQNSPDTCHYHAALALLGHNSWIDGDYLRSIHALKQVIAEFSNDLDLSTSFTYGLHAKAWALGTLANITWFLSEDNNEPLQLINEAETLANRLNHIPTLGIVWWLKALIHYYYNDENKVQKYAQKVLFLSQEYGLKQYECYMEILLAWVETNPQRAQKALQFGEMIGTKNALTFYTSILADIEYQLGNLDTALSINAKALKLGNEMHEYYYESELYRKRALYLISQNFKKNYDQSYLLLMQSKTKAENLQIKRCEKLSQNLLNHYFKLKGGSND